jgi:NAD+ diphosphatase
MIGFTARYAGGELMPDGIEIADARWFTRGSIQEVIADPEGNSAGVEMPGPGSVSRFLINRWLSAAE